MKAKKILCITAAVLLLLFAAFFIYTADYYHADENTLRAVMNTSTAEIIQTDDMMIFKPENPVAGFIFYPGGKVEHTAYAPLMQELSEQDILCVILKVPFNLAVLDMNAADRAVNMYPEISTWYTGGHSLGGVVASDYAHSHSDLIRGVVLLGSYVTEDFTDSDIAFLSVYGSNDGVMNAGRYAENFSKLPADTAEYIIEGGCHSYFADYGMQKGDGEPTVSRSEQIETTASLILSLLK